MNGSHTSVEVRRDVVKTLESLRVRTKIPMTQLLAWTGVHKSRYDRWRQHLKCTAPKPAQRLQASTLLPEERDVNQTGGTHMVRCTATLI